MNLAYAVLLCLHLLAAAFWVGGMAALHFAVRPAGVERLEPAQRLAFFDAALARFFAGVTAAIVVILLSGPAMIVLAGGLARMHLGVAWMMLVGLVMMLLFGYARWRPLPRLRRAVSAGDWPAAAAQLAAIRRLVEVNLLLGVLVFVVAIVGRVL
jgi:uncharacterized membrane protein